ncbi:LytTR family DNA-binding domain-containing protein [Spiribacter insolitus]|uniref:LytTR family DNA-binding domain-containing protein n=1 Tax=Spiribacter insolitus TaxID=3122417 RepID=A0ABV3T678_9GAMM
MRERLMATLPYLVLPLGSGLVLGVIGPFGTYERLPLQLRVPYWVIVFSLNWLIADALIRRVERMFNHHRRGSALFTPLAGALLAAPPATGLVALANAVSGIGWPENIVRLAGQVLFLLIAVSIAAFQWRRILAQGSDDKIGEPPETPTDESDHPDPTIRIDDSGVKMFMARLTDSCGEYPLCLQMQDHYLITYREASSEMILCRMEDAARELECLGRRVHRSWWVAERAIEAVERDGNRICLRLINGLRVPVGRSFRHSLKDAGWV